MTASHFSESSNRQPEQLSDQALLNEFGELVRKDHRHVASLLRHIDVIDRRKLWARQGYSSLFDFLVKRYHMSEATAAKRIGAARAARRFPVLFAMVSCGEIHLSGIHRIQAHLTPDNHEHVLAMAKHKTMRELDELVAHLAPQPDVPTTLRALPQRSSDRSSDRAPAAAREPERRTIQPAPSPRPHKCDPGPRPLAPGRFKLQLTINQSTRNKLEQLCDLLGHQVPKGDVAAIVERAFDALLDQIHKRKTGITAKPRVPRARTDEPTPTGKRTRHLPVSVRREVWPRDDGRCGFVGEDGHRCNATRGLQFAHGQPWAKGGANTADNIELRCPAHNALEADRDYGTGFMATKRKQRQSRTQPLEFLKVREPFAHYGVRVRQTRPVSSRIEKTETSLTRALF